MNSFECGSLQSAKVVGSQLMNKQGIQLAIRDLFELKGHGREFRAEKIGFHMDSANPIISLKALEMGCKLAGDEQEAKTQIPEKHRYIEIDISSYEDRLIEEQENA